MKHRFEKYQPLLIAFSVYAASRFSEVVRNFKTAHDLQPRLNTFCKTYNLDAFICIDELFNFVRSFTKFDYTTTSMSHEDNEEEEDDSDDDKLSSRQLSGDGSDDGVDNENETQKKLKVLSFTEALVVLCHLEYSLFDAYPTLCQVYYIAAAIPITAATAERSFSALKRVRTRIRSSMVQERVESFR